MASLSLLNVAKNYSGISAVRGISVEIPSGEFFSILGPSGCGKTTLLRMIAGFESPSAGVISLDGKDITRTPPQDREIGMVFQNYALFPHMTVFQNIAFGLHAQHRHRDEVEQRVRKMLDTVNLREKRNTSVTELSGGEQQRVAVGRALVVEPSVLLFDEPLSNLDIALRLKTREEIRALQHRTGITTVYVTHDQAEAMSLSDRVAVMREGRVEQMGKPETIYEDPASPFVASFVGGANILTGVVARGGRTLTIGVAQLSLPLQVTGVQEGPVKVALKPEGILLSPVVGVADLRGTVVAKEYLGFTTNFEVTVGDIRIRGCTLSNAFDKELQPGSDVNVSIDWKHAVFFPGGGE